MPRLLILLALVNAVAFLAFWWDKAMARSGAARIPERHLLWLAFLGGSAGSLAAQRLFRHKTRKEPFRTRLNALAWLNAVCAAVLAGWWLAAA